MLFLEQVANDLWLALATVSVTAQTGHHFVASRRLTLAERVGLDVLVEQLVRVAAAPRLGTASMNLGYCYLQGYGVPADKGEALRLFRRAVGQGEEKARKEIERLEGPIQRSWVGIVDATVPSKNFGPIGVASVRPPAPQQAALDAGDAADEQREG